VDTHHDLDVVTVLAAEAGRVAMSYFRSNHIGTREKGSNDVVTAADLACEQILREGLSTAFPDDGIIGEEGTAIRSTSGREWYIDPIDGTLNYSRGLSVWCLSIAALDEHGPVLAVIHDPIRGDTYRAARDRGAIRNGERLRVSGQVDPTRALVHVTIDFEEPARGQSMSDLAALAPRVLRTRNLGSAALALAYVASGELDAMIHRKAHTWDYAAGVLLIQEAGGSVTDLRGRAFDSSTTALVAASSEALRRELLRVVMQ
jgi:myo-inositol-1(or 4)-monophosphatase